MAAAVASSASYQVPLSQNTAPVIEYRCLWTRDLVQKHKRWQDGRLKFHTFNKRVMVYDEKANYVGDSHWREPQDLTEGDELQLERGGVMVETQERIGRTDQDLTELIEKRVQEVHSRRDARKTVPGRGVVGGLPLNQKSLNVLLGTPIGHHGRAAMITTSPYDQRCIAKGIKADTPERPAKRQRPNSSPPRRSHYAQALTGTALVLSSTARPQSSTNTFAAGNAIERNQVASKTTIDLTAVEDDDAASVTPQDFRTNKRPQEYRVEARRRERYEHGYAKKMTGVTLDLNTAVARRTAKQFERQDDPRQEEIRGKSPPAQSQSVANDARSADRQWLRQSPQRQDLAAPTRQSGENNQRGKSSKPARDRLNSDQSRTTEQGLTKVASTPNGLPRMRHSDQAQDGTPASIPEIPFIRIKARPKRKKMMLVADSLSFVSRRDQAAEETRSGMPPGGDKNGAVLASQSSKALEEFRSKQQSRLRAKLDQQERTTSALSADDIATSSDDHYEMTAPDNVRNLQSIHDAHTAPSLQPGPTQNTQPSTITDAVFHAPLDRGEPSRPASEVTTITDNKTMAAVPDIDPVSIDQRAGPINSLDSSPHGNDDIQGCGPNHCSGGSPSGLLGQHVAWKSRQGSTASRCNAQPLPKGTSAGQLATFTFSASQSTPTLGANESHMPLQRCSAIAPSASDGASETCAARPPHDSSTDSVISGSVETRQLLGNGQDTTLTEVVAKEAGRDASDSSHGVAAELPDHHVSGMAVVTTGDPPLSAPGPTRARMITSIRSMVSKADVVAQPPFRLPHKISVITGPGPARTTTRAACADRGPWSREAYDLLGAYRPPEPAMVAGTAGGLQA